MNPGYPSYPPQGPGQPTSQPSAPMYQTAPLAYPVYPGSAAPQPSPYPYPSHTSSPYPSGNPSPNPSNPAPYPGGSPYPPSSSASTSPYPSGNPTPYPSGNPTPYPSGNPAPYPSGNPAPYPGAVSVYPAAGGGGFPKPSPGFPIGGSQGTSYPPTSSPYPGSNNSPYPGSTGSNNSPYPGPTGINNAPYPGSNNSPYPQSNGSNNSPYPGSIGTSPYSSANSSYPGSHSSYPNASRPGAGYPSGGPQRHESPAHFSQYGNKPPQPTLRPANPFNPREDAEILRKAMKGFGTDEKALIQVLCNRTNTQRQQIAHEFKTLYGKDLVSDLKSETSGNFERALVALMTPLPEYLAKQVHKAIEGIGTVEETLVEILCTASNYEIRCIAAAYEKLYGNSLESDLASDTSGNFKRLLVSISQGNRSEVYQVDPNAAVQDAQALLRAGELRLGTDESTFNAILCSRSYPQLAHVFAEYQRLTGNDFETAIRNEFSGDVQEGLLAIVKSTTNKSRFFAEEIHKSMKGAGTEDEALIRLIVSRSEIDLGNIKEAYTQLYGRSIQEDVADEASGSYKNTLLVILVGN